jgi:hypothetical protein
LRELDYRSAALTLVDVATTTNALRLQLPVVIMSASLTH